MSPEDPKELLKRYEPREIKVLKPDRQMCTARFSPCGRFLIAGGTDARIRRWDLADEQVPELSPLEAHGGWVQALGFHPDAARPLLFSADSWGKLCCWPYAEAEPAPAPAPSWTVADAHDGWIRGLAVHPAGDRIATCGRDGVVRVWSSVDGKKLQEFASTREAPDAVDVFALAFHPDGAALVSGDLKGVLTQWDLASGKAVRTLDAQVFYTLDRIQDIGGLRRLRFDPDGKTLAAAGTTPKNGASLQGTPTIVLFDWDSGTVLHTLKVGTIGDGYVFDVHWHPDRFLMGVTSGNPGTGKFFFMRPGDTLPFFLLTRLPNCHALDVHPDGRRLIVAATNANSNGNGRQIGKGKDYPGNWSPLHVWELPRTKPAS
jgi:WD40 repeat protein